MEQVSKEIASSSKHWRSKLNITGWCLAVTLAEDQDLTLSVRRIGFRLGYEEDAVAWTEAPDSLKGLSRQRFRRSFGTLQWMWKHKDARFRRRYDALGFIAMPNVWIFQILFALIGWGKLERKATVETPS